MQGALIGLLLSLIINLWLGIGAVLYGKPPKLKAMSTENCNYLNRTNFNFIEASNSTLVSQKFKYFNC